MSKETKKLNIYEKLFAIQGTTIAKNEKNPFFKSKYLTLDKLLKELQPILGEVKLLIYHYTEENVVITKIVDTEAKDSFISSAFPLQEGLEPQKVGSAITYAKRYNIGQLLNIITDEDDDGNTSSPTNTKKTVAKPTTSSDEHNGVKLSDYTCSICGKQVAKLSKAGNPYCGQFNSHPEGSLRGSMLTPKEVKDQKDTDEFLSDAGEPNNHVKQY